MYLSEAMKGPKEAKPGTFYTDGSCCMLGMGSNKDAIGNKLGVRA
jgi:hypothetical protein